KNVSEERRRGILKKYKLPKRFFVYVGVLERRKNIDGLIKIADLLKEKTSVPIVLFGSARRGRRYLNEFDRRGNIFYRGFIEDADLVDVYNLATAFVFPSLYEGFGLPVLEAMKSGLPVVASNSSSLPEVVGDAAPTCSPEDYECFSNNLLELSGKRDLWDQYKNAGLKQAARFSWKGVTAETVSLFNSVNKHNSNN
ncbi:MAG: glycosyltransferase family 4 protein, partial [Patescibacteria group bacterium]|nr:glycosyltransferase family 4 protein [Patescibacteria group bacterium]